MNWKRNLGLVLLALSPLLISSCLNDDDVEYYDGPVAYVSYYHASPETGSVSIYADGRLYNSNNFEYTDYFTYGNYFTGERDLSFKNRNAANSLLDTAVTLEENQPYTFFFIDGEEDSDMGVVIAEDNWEDPEENKAMVRFAHLSKDAPEVDLFINEEETPFVSNVSFKEVSDFIEIDADLTSFTVKNAGTDETLLTAEDLNLRTQRIYTVIVRGYADPQNSSSSEDDLSLQVIRNYPNY
ncbi:DUF4397 domain-containing protein [Echinicola sediminis]